ncbi:MAG: hypothetical protein RLZZ28_2492, partial [Bacteroidota bacterium]
DFGNSTLKAGFIAERLKVENTDGKYISTTPPGTSAQIFDWNNFLGVNLQYSVLHSNHPRFPSRGYQFVSGISYKKNISTANRDFFQLTGAFSFYLPLGKMVLAHRIGAAVNMGDYEFYHANTLGGNVNLRGYLRTRFTGTASFFQNTELRFTIADLKGFVFKGKLGGYSFVDDGRVWVKEEDSNKIHMGYGMGIFFVPFNAATLNLSVGTSGETTILRFGLAFFY